MIRVAAVGDVHYDRNPREKLREQFKALAGIADLFLIAGDLTQTGAVEEARALAQDLVHVPIPVIAVLGNHDYNRNCENEIKHVLNEAGVTTLEGESAVYNVRGSSVGVTGLKGFGGGFFGACIAEFGEPETKAFARHCRLQADALRLGLVQLRTDYKFALLHFSPVEGTLLGERKEIYPFLGSYLLSEAIDDAQVNGAFHGHAHMGVERSVTPGGVPVRNVAQMVIRHSYKVYTFE